MAEITKKFYGDKEHVEILRQQIETFIKTTDRNFIMIAGGRDVGKTYTTQKVVSDFCITNKRQFVLLSPTKDMLNNGLLSRWYNKYSKTLTDKSFKYTSTEILCHQKHTKGDWLTIGLGSAIGAAEAEKLFTDPDVDYMIFDEAFSDCTVETKRKIVTKLLTKYETIDRAEDRVKTIILGNLIPNGQIDPLYEFFGVTPEDLQPQNEGLMIEKGDNMVFWYVPRPADVDIVNSQNGKQTKFSRMIEGTEYSEISKGTVGANFGNLIKMPEGGKFANIFAIDWGGCYTAVYLFKDNPILFFEKIDPDFYVKFQKKFTFSMNNIDENIKLMPVQLCDKIRRYIQNGRLKFVDINTYSNMQYYFKKVLNISI